MKEIICSSWFGLCQDKYSLISPGYIRVASFIRGERISGHISGRMPHN